jgi:methyl-accepting chemotaxis protein
MGEKIVRKPIGNFFIKKALQIRLIVKVMIAALVSSILSSGALLLVYYLRYETVVVYQWNQVNNELMRENIINLLLPTLAISSLVGLIVAAGIGLYASRKYAVPIYKIENWASMILNGNMGAVLKFREHEEMRELSEKCNEVTAMLRNTLLEIKDKVKVLQDTYPQDSDIESLAAVLDKMELSGEIRGKIKVKS